MFTRIRVGMGYFLGNSFIENNIPMSNRKRKRNVSSNCNSNSWIRFDFKSEGGMK